MITPERAGRALDALDRWLEHHQFAGWDPHDALNSPVLKTLTFRNQQLGQIVVQLVKRSPVNLRPLLRVKKGFNPKAMGLFLGSYAREYHRTRSELAAERVRFFAEWLVAHTSPGASGPSWGYHFDWPNRSFFAPAGTPTIVNTAFVALGFLDLADEAHPVGGFEPARALAVARGACAFVLHDLWQARPRPDELCFSYTPLDRRLVHNANLLGARLLAEVAARTRERRLTELALAAARFTVRRQRSNGSWVYGESAGDQWVDNFHTGYVLVALSRIATCAATTEFDEAIERGYSYWKDSMFLGDGTPKSGPNKVYPIDAHNVAQAVLTFLEFAGRDPEAREWSSRVLDWGVSRMQDPLGFFHYQISRLYRIEIPYIRWVQAWMHRALTEWLHQQQLTSTAAA